jgi:hypothetical protein
VRVRISLEASRDLEDACEFRYGAEEVARRTRYTAGRIYQFCCGEKPSGESVERLVEHFDLNVERQLAFGLP